MESVQIPETTFFTNEQERQEMKKGLEAALDTFKKVESIVKEKFGHLSKEDQYQLTKMAFNKIIGMEG